MKSTLPKVLLVDDSSTNNLLLESALKRLDITISTAISGEEALKMMRKNNFDLVLLDVMMPGLSGFEVLTEMGKDNALKGVPVIMVTALNSSEEKVKAKKLGAADYFEKPLELDKLVERVNDLVSQSV